ncbi:hypothetical protein [Pollutimonas sp. M17]|uniref:hypothetical protein n=1 Tax=Pollutimonas sp. M17 TaxID=2962065 RepID=UPI0021F4719E|nr:hypothetical protein [Pollutimonas sp. M17]UYO92769.1 hypothetical protein OEG81_12805 [Pollutimonas sp. M17]
MKIESLNLVVDINHDGAYSMWELWEAVKFVYRVPGNLLVEGLGHIPYVSSFLGIRASEAAGYGSLDGLLSITLSLMFWIVVLFSALTLSSPSEDDAGDSAEKAPGPALEAPSGFPLEKSGHTPSAGARDDGAWVSSAVRGHLPVSRSAYSAPGSAKHKKPRRRHMISYLIRHAK